MQAQATTKAYRARSVVDTFMGHMGVTFNWYCCERERPLRPFQELVEGYCRLSDHAKLYAEGAANEYLTEEEVKQLRVYLADIHGPNVLVEEVHLPIRADLARWGSICTDASGIPTGWVCLSELDGYSLAVPIWAYYDLRAAEQGAWAETTPEEDDTFYRGLLDSLLRDVPYA